MPIPSRREPHSVIEAMGAKQEDEMSYDHWINQYLDHFSKISEDRVAWVESRIGAKEKDYAHRVTIEGQRGDNFYSELLILKLDIAAGQLLPRWVAEENFRTHCRNIGNLVLRDLPSSLKPFVCVSPS